MTEIESLLALCRKWAEREEEITTEEALTVLTELYMSQCGISLTLRTLAFEAGSYWLQKLSLSDHPLADLALKKSFTMLMPYFSEEFAAKKEHYWEYDISYLDEDCMIPAATDILTEEWEDDRLRIAFACGFISYYEAFKEFERDYNQWLQSKKAGE